MQEADGRTSFIYPGYTFRVLLTPSSPTFTSPKSTLVMLVSAFAGRELTMKSYREAVQGGVPFFQFRRRDAHHLTLVLSGFIHALYKV